MSSTDILTLVESTHNDLSKLRNQFSKEKDTKRRSEHADTSINTVAMFINGENAVIYPTVQAHMPAEQAAGTLRDACVRLRDITRCLDRLERLPVDTSDFTTAYDHMLKLFENHYTSSRALIQDLRSHMDAAAFNSLAERWVRVCENAPRRTLGSSLSADNTSVAPAGDVGQKAGAAENPVTLSERLDRILDETEELVKRMAQEEKMKPEQQSLTTSTTTSSDDSAAASKVFPTGESLGTATTIGVQGPKALAKQEMEQQVKEH
ncbi:hypothetical protein BGW41_004797 [Actinomortierella wolfii]|nr:hypothetical protein BGW41_004797 [Actinomortierella wolfii]